MRFQHSSYLTFCLGCLHDLCLSETVLYRSHFLMWEFFFWETASFPFILHWKCLWALSCDWHEFVTSESSTASSANKMNNFQMVDLSINGCQSSDLEISTVVYKRERERTEGNLIRTIFGLGYSSSLSFYALLLILLAEIAGVFPFHRFTYLQDKGITCRELEH